MKGEKKEWLADLADKVEVKRKPCKATSADAGRSLRRESVAMALHTPAPAAERKVKTATPLTANKSSAKQSETDSPARRRSASPRRAVSPTRAGHKRAALDQGGDDAAEAERHPPIKRARISGSLDGPLRGEKVLLALKPPAAKGISNKDLKKQLKEQGAKLGMLTLAGCSKLTDEAIHYIAEYCTKLEELDLSGCTNIGYDAMLAIREIGKGQTLRVLKLAGTHVKDVDISALLGKVDEHADEEEQLTKGVRKLEKLDLSDTGVSAAGLAYRAELGKLRTLTLRKCHGLTKEAFKAIAKLELGALDLSGCDGLRDAGLQALSKRPLLWHLDLSGTAITDNGLKYLRHSQWSYLKHLHLTGVKGVTDKGIEAMEHPEGIVHAAK